MQTSKSYGGRSNNVEVKLELDDLEYVFADGQNLIINSEGNSEDTDEGNIVYTDGSQAVVLQTGVKHYIQTLGGETYLLGSDSDNIQQLVINSEDQSEESNNSEIEYVHDEENGEAVIYKVSDTDNEFVDCEPEPKRFKIGNTEYVTLRDSDNLEANDDEEINVLDENSVSENTNFHYAILKDGKLQLRLCDMNSIEVLNDTSNEDEPQMNKVKSDLQEDPQEYVVDKMEEYVLVNTDLPTDNTMGVSKLSEKYLISGKAITLGNYLSQMEYKINDIEDSEKDGQNCDGDQFLNKKLLIRKNSNGKSLFGKILHIEPAKKVVDFDEETQDMPHGNEISEAVILNVDPENVDVNPTSSEDDDIGNEPHTLAFQEPEEIDDIEYNQDISVEDVNFLTKTLCGLINMPNLRKKLLDHQLEIKYVEEKWNDVGNEVDKEVRYVSGHLSKETNQFLLDDIEHLKDVTSLTVIAFHDINNDKTTKVIFHEKLVACQMCNRTFCSLGLLNRHLQTYHTERTSCCNVCQLKFANHVLLTNHRKASGHFFNCDSCSKRFTTQSSLKRHQVLHDVIKTYQCETCGKSFTSFADLSVHRKVHNPAKSYYCDICRREFSRHSNLSRHAEIHKGDGDLYKCGICECSYKFISSLTRHIVQNHMKQTV